MPARSSNSDVSGGAAFLRITYHRAMTTGSAQRTERRAREKSATRAGILDAARAVASRDGARNLSLRGVAAEAGFAGAIIGVVIALLEGVVSHAFVSARREQQSFRRTFVVGIATFYVAATISGLAMIRIWTGILLY